MRKVVSCLLIFSLVHILINICYADTNICRWRNTQLTIPNTMIFQPKEKMAIIATSTKNPSSFLVISQMNNLTSDDIIQNLRKNNHVVKMKEIKNTRIAKYDCIKIVYEHIIDKQVHISYLFDNYNIRLIYVGCYKNYKLYEPIINSLTIVN